jgi:hypothetical protein
MADKKQATPGVKPTAEPGDQPYPQSGNPTTQPDTTMDANSAAVDAYRHPLAPAPEQAPEAAPAPTGDTATSSKES